MDQHDSAAAPAPRERGVKRTRRAYLSADQRRQQILRAAQEAFAGSSLHGVSTREIAKAADINPAALFEHFGSKEALFREAVIGPLFRELRDMKSRAAVYSSAAPDVTIEVAQGGVMRQMAAMTRLFPLLTTALFSDLETGKALYREQFIPFLEERTNMLRGLAKPETDSYFLELMVVGMLFFLAMDETFGDGRLGRPAAAEQLIRLITFGTAPRPHEAVATRHPAPGADLHQLRRLGSSDLWISPLGLKARDYAVLNPAGAVTDLEAVVDTYLARGGNFIEVTNFFGDAAIEQAVTRLIADRRDDIVLASSHRMLNIRPGTRSGGTFCHKLIESVDDSLKALGADHFDLFTIETLDRGVHPAEVVDACEQLIRDGKIRFAGLSEMPAWQIAQIHMLAQGRGKSPFVAVSTVYGASDRSAERELLPMADEMGLGVISSPPETFEASTPNSDGKADLFGTFAAIAEEIDGTASQVALAWKFLHRGIASAMIHPQNNGQLDTCIAALQIEFSANQIERLESVVRGELK